MLKLKLVTPPEMEPVTKEQIKPQLRIELDDDSFDDEIDDLIPAARHWCEEHQNRAYITQTWERALDSWPSHGDRVWSGIDFIKLPRPPLQKVEAFEYANSSVTKIEWPSTNYIVDTFSEPGRVVPVKSWPNVSLPKANGIIIRYVVGYGDSPDDVPRKVKQAIIMLVAHWFENGVCDPPPAVYSLLSSGRVIPI